MSKSEKIQNFKVLQLYFSKNDKVFNELFVKEHSVRKFEDEKPSGRTLFIINVPPYATSASIRNAFSQIGEVESVTLRNNITSENEDELYGFKIGFVVFKNKTSMKSLLDSEDALYISTKEAPLKTGLSKWIDEYNSSICDHKTLSTDVQTYMEQYDQLVAEEKKIEEEAEGWQLVTRKGRNPGLARKESVGIKLKQKNLKASKKKELKNFYTFQIKEQKMKNIVALRKSFQESKEKVAALKKLRVFRPY